MALLPYVLMAREMTIFFYRPNEMILLWSFATIRREESIELIPVEKLHLFT